MGPFRATTVSERRAEHLERLYRAIGRLRDDVGGVRTLAAVDGRSGWPTHGVYLFFEPGEWREDGRTPRVTRVGTHALTATSRTTLWQRLAQHRGSVGGRNPGGGNHRGSVFRYHIGSALIVRDGWSGAAETWGRGSHASAEVRAREVELERAVSRYIRAMPLLWLEVPDRNDRRVIEQDLIALLSNADWNPLDPAADLWLGRHAAHPAIRRSGLWNVHHVDARFDGACLDRFVERVGGS
jgi:hypothetical protein